MIATISAMNIEFENTSSMVGESTFAITLSSSPLVTTFPPIKFYDLLAFDPKPEENFILGNGLLKRGSWTLLTGGTGIGKSVLVEQFAACIACGKSPFGLKVSRPFRILLVTAENDMEVLKRDFESIAEHENLDFELLNENIQMHHAYSLGGSSLVSSIKQELVTGGFDVCILDNYQAFNNDDINSTQAWKAFITPFVNMLKDTNSAMLMVDHTGKPQERKNWGENDSVYLASGTSGKANGARASIELFSPKKGDSRYLLKFGKNWVRAGLEDEDGNRVRDVYLDRSPSLDKPYWVVSDDQGNLQSPLKGEAEVLGYAKINPDATYREIEAVLGISSSQVGRIMLKNGLGRKDK